MWFTFLIFPVSRTPRYSFQEFYPILRKGNLVKFCRVWAEMAWPMKRLICGPGTSLPLFLSALNVIHLEYLKYWKYSGYLEHQEWWMRRLSWWEKASPSSPLSSNIHLCRTVYCINLKCPSLHIGYFKYWIYTEHLEHPECWWPRASPSSSLSSSFSCLLCSLPFLSSKSERQIFNFKRKKGIQAWKRSQKSF